MSLGCDESKGCPVKFRPLSGTEIPFPTRCISDTVSRLAKSVHEEKTWTEENEAQRSRLMFLEAMRLVPD